MLLGNPIEFPHVTLRLVPKILNAVDVIPLVRKELGVVDPEGCDQFNDLHESIVQAFPLLGIKGLSHFACNQDIEDDKGTLDYLEECAREAGLETRFLAMEDVGIDDQGRFTDLDERVITTLIKLYPWEWIMDEAFGRHVPTSGCNAPGSLDTSLSHAAGLIEIAACHA